MRVVIVAVGTAGEGDHSARRQTALASRLRRLALRKSRLSITAAVMRAMVDHRAGVRPPDGAGDLLVAVGCGVAQGFDAVAAVDETCAFGEQAFEFDRADFGAVLFALAALLRVLVVVELALHAVDGAVKEH